MLLPIQIKPVIPYFGGKGKLTPWICEGLSNSVPIETWNEMVFIDLFLGGGSVSQQAKFLNFKALQVNDCSERSNLIAEGIIANSHTRLPLDLALEMALYEDETATFVQGNFAGTVFSKRHAQKLDTAVAFANRISDLRLRALLLLLVWRQVLRSVAFGTSVGTSNRPFAEALDGNRAFASLNPKRFRDGSLGGLLEPCWLHLEKDVQDLNRCIYPTSAEVTVFQEDVFELIPKLTGHILYLDPPYPGTMGYTKSNEVLDTVLFGKLPESQPNSPFTKSPQAISELLDLSRHIPTWALSLNDKVLNLDELKALVKAVDPSRDVQGYAKAYAHLPHVAKRQNNELLVIATER